MHSYLIGQSGAGKSTKLLELILATSGGFCLLDPHGDLAEAVANRLDCIYFDPTLVPIPLNVLKDIPTAKRHLVTDNTVAIFRKLYADSWGPRMEHILRHSIRLLLDNNRPLSHIPRLLTDINFRKRCLKRASSGEFWYNEFQAWSDRDRNEYIQPILNKLGQFTFDPVLSACLGGNRIDLVKLMNTRKRLVVNLSKPKLGETPSRLLGALLVTALYQSAQVGERQPFTLFADEFQNFASDSFADLLSEARKFGLQLVLAHQLLGQLSEPLREAVLGNVSSITAFRVSPEDAPILAAAIGLQNPEILSDLGNFEAWTNASHPPQPRLIKTSPPPPTFGKLQSNIVRTGGWYGGTHT